MVSYGITDLAPRQILHSRAAAVTLHTAVTSGGDDTVDRRAMLTALNECRQSMLRDMPNMKPIGPMYHFASGVLAAIDALATFITRDATYFHDKGTTGRPSEWKDEQS